MCASARLLLLGLTAAWLSACAKSVDLPPTTVISGRSCAAQFDISSARDIVLNGKTLSVSVDANSPCTIDQDNASSLYNSFRLPTSEREYFVSVLSSPVGDGLLSPRVIMLDANGVKLREVPRDAFVFHGSALYLGVRVRAGERYLIVASDPATVGHEISQTFDATQSNVYAAGPVFVNVNTGSSTMKTEIYSHTGSLTITAQQLPGEK